MDKKKPSLSHIQRQYIKWWKYMRAEKDADKRAKMFKSAVILSNIISVKEK